MNKKKNLYIFTRKFPFGDITEIFLKNELEIANQLFNIILIPLTRTRYSRGIPDDIFINDCCYRRKLFLYLTVLYEILFSKLFWSALLFQKNRIIKMSISQKKFYITNLVGAYIIYSAIKHKKINVEDNAIIYTYWFSYAPLGISMLKENGFLKSNYFISRAHSYEIHEEELNIIFPCRNLTFKNIDRVYSISHKGANLLIEKYPNYKEKIFVSHLGVPEIKDTNGANSNSIKIISCSGVRAEKRIDLLYKSINEYAISNKKRIEWTHIGDGPKMKILKKLVENKSNMLNVNLIGQIDNNDIIEIYRTNSYNIFINLSLTEGVPVSIMEAISSSIPVIATDVGETSEIVNSETGTLVKSDFSQEEFNEAVDYILNNNYTLSKSCFSFYKKNFSSFDNYTNFYKSLI